MRSDRSRRMRMYKYVYILQKQLYQEQITIFREKQKEEIALIERREQEALRKLSESSRTYEEHIKSLTSELWNVGEKYLMKTEEAQWLKRRQASGSLMSLQHVNSVTILFIFMFTYNNINYKLCEADQLQID